MRQLSFYFKLYLVHQKLSLELATPQGPDIFVGTVPCMSEGVRV